MSDIVVGVRLNADGSGLVGQVKLSNAELDRLRVAERGAAEAARDLTQATAGAGTAQREAATSSRDAAEATNALGVAGRTTSTGAREMATVLDRAAVSVGAIGGEARKTAFQLSDLSTRSKAQIEQAKRQSDAVVGLNRNIGLQRVGYQQLGYQLQDVGASYASGTRLATIAAQQVGQLGSALSLIAQGSENAGGKMGKFATILGGPWAIAATVAISLGAALWSELSKVDAANEAAAKSTIDFSSSLVAQQNIVASATDGIKQLEEATRGLINTQAILLDNLKAVSQAGVGQLESQLAGIDRQIAEKSSTANSMLANMPGTFGLFGDGPSAKGLIEQLRAERAKVASDLASARGSLATSTVGLEERNSIERVDPNARAKGEIERERARLRERRRFTLNQERGAVPFAGAPSLEQISKAEFDRQIGDLQRRDNALKDHSKPKKDNSAAKAVREAERLAQFGERAEDAIARLNDQFNIAPRDIDQARVATDKLDDVIVDLAKRKPKNFEELIAQAQAVKPLIEQSLIRPFNDIMVSQERQIALGKIQMSGREADAEALQLTYSLMDKVGVETEDQLVIELAKRGVTEDQVRALYGNLEVMRQQTQEMRVQQQVQQMFLSAVGDMRENVRLTLQDLRQEGPKALGDFAKRSLDVFDRLFSEVVTEKLFGGLFRDLESQITGGDKISKAGDQLADAVGKASKDIKQTSADILDLGKAASTAAGMIAGKGAGGSIPSGWIVGDDGKAFDPNVADIMVTAPKTDLLKELKSGFKEGFEGVFDDLKGGFKTIFSDVFGEGGLFNASLAKTLGRLAGYGGLGGASGSLVTGLLGIQGSGTGGMIGGALGGKLGEKFLSKGLEGIAKGLGDFAGPLGSIAGGVLGSVVGGLLKKTKSGAANITSVDGDATLSGNSSAFKKAAGGAADSVQDGLSQIAETLGGAIGAFNVTIGQRHDDWRVRSGTGSLKIAKGAKEFDGDQAGAIAYAIQLAVSQGAVTGISAAIDKALRSSDDINEALTEALKVQEIEQMLGGLGSEMAKQFRAFEAQAKDRLRIATQYGFDVVKIEAKNAEDRAKLVDQILTDRVGSLQALLNDMKFGSLAEGSFMDQRTALLAQIATARADAEAGKDGAADKLASLTRTLVESSRDNLGTAGGEYAADRSTAIDAAEAVIKAENERIKAAQGEQVATNAKLDQANSLSAQQVDHLSNIESAIQALVARGANPAIADTAWKVADIYREQVL